MSAPSTRSRLIACSSLLVAAGALAAGGCAEPSSSGRTPAGTVAPPMLVTQPPPPAGGVPPPATSAEPTAPVAQPAEPTRPQKLARHDGSAQDANLAEGDALYEKDDFAGAEAAYRKAMQLAPKDPAPIVGFARARL